jgi:hypothetical protein
LLDTVVQITLDPLPGLICGRDNPCAGGGQGDAALGVRDRRGNEFGEACKTRFSVPVERRAVLLVVGQLESPLKRVGRSFSSA